VAQLADDHVKAVRAQVDGGDDFAVLARLGACYWDLDGDVPFSR
jgi:hypothetical protein